MEGERVDGQEVERGVEPEKKKKVFDVWDDPSWTNAKGIFIPHVFMEKLTINGCLRAAQNKYAPRWAAEVEEKMERRFGPRKPDWMYEMWTPEARRERVW